MIFIYYNLLIGKADFCTLYSRQKYYILCKPPNDIINKIIIYKIILLFHRDKVNDLLRYA